MPKAINTPAVSTTQPANAAKAKQYDAGDLMDAHSFSQHYYESLDVLINTARLKLLDDIRTLQQCGFPDLREDYFHSVLKLLEVAEETSDTCGQQSKKLAEKYDAEYKASREQEASQ